MAKEYPSIISDFSVADASLEVKVSIKKVVFSGVSKGHFTTDKRLFTKPYSLLSNSVKTLVFNKAASSKLVFQLMQVMAVKKTMIIWSKMNLPLKVNFSFF